MRARGGIGPRPGFALVSVLWGIGLLALVAAATVRLAYHEGRHAEVSLAVARAQAMADGAVRLAILRVLAGGPEGRWDGAPAIQAGATVSVQDQGGLINLDLAEPALLAGLLSRAGGLDADPASRLAAAIVAERGAPPAGGPFLSPVDLVRVPGMTPALLTRLLPYVTIHSGLRGVDPRTAPAVVLDATPHPTGPYFADSRGNGVRISARAVVDGAAAMRVADVRLVRDGHPPYKILTWTMEPGG